MTTAKTPVIDQLVAKLESTIADPRQGLQEEIFLLVGRLTPLVNVDLLIRHPLYGILLTWRSDDFHGSGWHVPGGIVRFQESFIDRIEKTAIAELGIPIASADGPIAVTEMRDQSRRDRSHFVSLLYSVNIKQEHVVQLENWVATSPTEIQFFKDCPETLLSCQSAYKPLFETQSIEKTMTNLSDT
jgi:ADP-ribose pyrophosphatase YjhB (NUDIX family)